MTAGAVLLLVAILTLCVNLYVQSTGVQARIAQGLSDAFHLQVKLGGASYTPWGGLHLTGIDVPQPDPAIPGSFLQTAEVSARIRLFSLLRRRLDISQLSVNDPKVVWVQNENGSWTLPEAPPPPPPPAPTPGATPSPNPIPNTPAATTQAAPPQPMAPPSPPFTVSVGHFRLKRASFEFVDFKGNSVASLTGIALECPNPTDTLVRGHIKSDKATFGGVVVLDDIGANFTFANGVLQLSDFDATVAEGHIRAAGEVRTTEPGSPFSAETQFEDIELQRVIPHRKNGVLDASGFLNGFLKAQGKASDEETITGTGQVVLRKGHVRYQLFQMLGDLLQIEELSELELDQAHVDYHLANGKVQVDEILLQSPNLRVSAHGNVAFDGRLDLASRLEIDKRISGRLPSIIRENFVTAEDAEFSHRDFNIRGTIGSPKTDLVQREMGRKIKRELTDILLNVFGGRRKEKPPAPLATPVVSPLPTPLVPAIAPTPTMSPSPSPPIPTPTASPTAGT